MAKARRQGGRVLSHQVEAIEYIHADDGLPYRHDFERGDSEIVLQGDGSVQVRNPRRRLWGLYDGQPFLENPPMTIRRKRKSARRRAGAKVRTATKRRATKRRKAARKSNPNTGVTMARKRSTRRRRNPAAAPARRRRRSVVRHRRNPPGFSPRVLVNTAMEGVIGGAEVVAGKAAVRLARKQLGYAAGTTVAAAIEAGLAIGAGMLAARFLGAEHGRRVLYGGMSAPIEAFVREAVKTNPKAAAIVQDALGDYGAYDTILAYPDYDAVAGYVGGGDSVGDAGGVAAGAYPYQY